MGQPFHNVKVIPGDLNGRTVTDSTLSLYPYFEPVLNKAIKHTTREYNADYFVKNDITELGPKELEDLADCDQIFLGAIGDPTKLAPGVIEIGELLKIRQEFEQQVNLRPVILPEGVPSVIVGKDYRDINFEICRENSEGLYVDRGSIENEGTDDEVGTQEMRCSYRAIKSLANFALDRARSRNRFDKPRVHFVFKTNVLTKAGAPWKRVKSEFEKEYGNEIDIRYMHVDIFNANMVAAPEQFDVVLTENMFGDITTDLGAIIQGGIGTAVSGNININGKYPSMFEPVHGSAPDKWYETDQKTGEYIKGTFIPDLVQKIKPEAAYRAYAMMLETMGEAKAAELVHGAALNNMRDPDYKTKTLDTLTEQAQNHIKENVE